MPVAFSNEETRAVIRLEGDIDIANSEELKTILSQAILQGTEMQIDLDSMIDLDVTAAQLLWSAAQEARRAGTSFSLLRIPDCVRVALLDMGFENFPVGPAVSHGSNPAGSTDDR